MQFSLFEVDVFRRLINKQQNVPGSQRGINSSNGFSWAFIPVTNRKFRLKFKTPDNTRFDNYFVGAVNGLFEPNCFNMFVDERCRVYN